MKYAIKRTSQFKKDFKLMVKRGVETNKFNKVIRLLADGGELPKEYYDHQLTNSKYYKDCRELHIEPDWLLIYKYRYNDLILILLRTGAHSDLF